MGIGDWGEKSSTQRAQRSCRSAKKKRGEEEKRRGGFGGVKKRTIARPFLKGLVSFR